MNKYDEYYNNIRNSIYNKVKNIPKQNKIRIEKWIEKLDEPVSNKFWKINRNWYIDLLYDSLTNPLNKEFNNIPNDNPLPILNKHIINKRLGNKTKNSINNMIKSPVMIKNSKKKISIKNIPNSLIKSTNEYENRNSINEKLLVTNKTNFDELHNIIDSINEYNINEKKKNLKFKIKDLKLKFECNDTKNIEDLIKRTDILIEENKRLLNTII